MHSGWDWSFKERLYTTTTYNTADETLIKETVVKKAKTPEN